MSMYRLFSHCYRVLAKPKTYCKMIVDSPSTQQWRLMRPLYLLVDCCGTLTKRGDALRHSNWYASFEKYSVNVSIFALVFDNHEGSPSSLFPWFPFSQNENIYSCLFQFLFQETAQVIAGYRPKKKWLTKSLGWYPEVKNSSPPPPLKSTQSPKRILDHLPSIIDDVSGASC